MPICSRITSCGLAKEDHTYRLTPEEKKRYQVQRYLTLNKPGKNGPVRLRSDFRAASTPRVRRTNNTGDGIPLQAHRGGTSLNGIGSELIRIF